LNCYFLIIKKINKGFEKTKHLLPTLILFGGVDQKPNFLPDYYLTPQAKKRRG
jgi:hypothetical protein